MKPEILVVNIDRMYRMTALADAIDFILRFDAGPDFLERKLSAARNVAAIMREIADSSLKDLARADLANRRISREGDSP